MKHKKWILPAPVIAAVLFLLATGGKILASGGVSELAKILESGLEGFKAYLNWLLEILKIVW